MQRFITTSSFPFFLTVSFSKNTGRYSSGSCMIAQSRQSFCMSARPCILAYTTSQILVLGVFGQCLWFSYTSSPAPAPTALYSLTTQLVLTIDT